MRSKEGRGGRSDEEGKKMKKTRKMKWLEDASLTPTVLFY